MLNELMNVLGSSATAVDLAAALCLLTGVDPTLLPLSGTTGGRVLSSMGRLAAGGCGPIQTDTSTAVKDVPAVPDCFESYLPAELETALTSAGVEPDVLVSLYFDEQHGQTFRQRIKSKWRTFTDLVSRGLVQSPTGFFVSAVRKNWHLSSTYEPGKKKAAPVAPDHTADLRAAREEAARVAQAALDALSSVSPAEQWAAHGSTLRLYLRWSSADLVRLERACLGGLSAAALAREGAAARLGGTVKEWAEGLRLRL